jgi:hypothetical protein
VNYIVKFVADILSVLDSTQGICADGLRQHLSEYSDVTFLLLCPPKCFILHLTDVNDKCDEDKVVPVLRLTEHYAMKAYGEVEVQLHPFFDLCTRRR